jgi:hypothetical protein
MWTRRTFHECAEELRVISDDFRAAYLNKFGRPRSDLDHVLVETSQRGVELLRILALSIRADQDYGLTNNDRVPVGAFMSSATQDEVSVMFSDYRPPYGKLRGSRALGLRQALNKIAHANPTRSHFFADEGTHDLILSGLDRGETWIAVISVIDLCRVIQSLPDKNIQQ